MRRPGQVCFQVRPARQVVIRVDRHIPGMVGDIRHLLFRVIAVAEAVAGTVVVPYSGHPAEAVILIMHELAVSVSHVLRRSELRVIDRCAQHGVSHADAFLPAKAFRY